MNDTTNQTQTPAEIVSPDENLAAGAITVEAEPVPAAEVPAPAVRPIEVRSRGLVAKGAPAQLYTQIPGAARLVGFETEEGVRVGRVTAGSRSLELPEGGSWPEVIGDGIEVGRSQYVTLHADNLGEPREIRAVLLFAGWEEAPAAPPPATSAEILRSAPVIGQSAIDPKAETTIVLGHALARLLLQLLRDGRHPPTSEMPKILGRLQVAASSGGVKEPARSPGAFHVRCTVGDVHDAMTMVRRTGTVSPEVRGSMVKQLEQEFAPKPAEASP